MNAIQSFIDAVTKSRVLSAEQKKELLDRPDELPDIYREHIVSQLAAFDEHSEYREHALRQKLSLSLSSFAAQLEAEHIDKTKKQELIQKAKAQIDQFFPDES